MTTTLGRAELLTALPSDCTALNDDEKGATESKNLDEANGKEIT
ncbi:MAG: hypothetical protein JWP25_5708 [Bradyrhizobium sp.]|nr:hypothetical protein [Bradyrhizobium sp.]